MEMNSVQIGTNKFFCHLFVTLQTKGSPRQINNREQVTH